MRLRPPAHCPFLSVLLAGFVAFALFNPFCCSSMPCFKAEVAQTETAFDILDEPCTGHPKSLRSDTSLFTPPELAIEALGPTYKWLAQSAATRVDPEQRRPIAATPRHKLLGIYLV